MKICIPIQLKSQDQVVKTANSLKNKADVVEVWLDHIQDLNLENLIKNITLPVLCVCKKPLDKGKFKGSYAEEAQVLIKAIKNGATYIDIPLKMPEKLNKKIVQEAQKKKVKVIISYHNFKKAPSKQVLLKKVMEMKKRRADIVKLAVMGENLKDSLDMIILAKELQQLGFSHILITMGKQGVLTRVMTPLLGGEMMFAPLKKSSSTANGQLTVDELREAWENFV